MRLISSISILLGFLLLCSPVVLYANGVLQTGMQSPLRIVKTRKVIMQMLVENLKDMSKKLDTKRAVDSAVNAGNISVLASVLPPLFRGAHKQVYPMLKGTRYYFKGVPGPGFEAQATNLWATANTLRKGLDTIGPVQARKFIGKLQESCKNCHALYRGNIR